MSDCRHESKTYNVGYQGGICEDCSRCREELRSFDEFGTPDASDILSQDQLRRILDICLEPKT